MFQNRNLQMPNLKFPTEHIKYILYHIAGYKAFGFQGHASHSTKIQTKKGRAQENSAKQIDPGKIQRNEESSDAIASDCIDDSLSVSTNSSASPSQ
jgi:hypothetical protein